MWSALSLVALLGGIGLVLGVYGRYRRDVGWHETEERRLRFLPPAEVALTPAQRSTAWFFLVVAALFVLQNLVAGRRSTTWSSRRLLRHRPARILPYNLTRTWHLQLAIFFVATAYLAAGIFLAPLIAGREPRGQGCCRASCSGRWPWSSSAASPASSSAITGYLRGHPAVLRGPGMGVPRTGPVLDVPAGRRHGPLGGDPLPRPAHPAGAGEPGQHALAVLLQPLSIPLFYAVGLVTTPGRRSPSPTSGGSGWSTSGSRTSSSSSPR